MFINNVTKANRHWNSGEYHIDRSAKIVYTRCLGWLDYSRMIRAAVLSAGFHGFLQHGLAM